MKSLSIIRLPLLILLSVNTLHIEAQSHLTQKIDFKNAPVLFKEWGKEFQQVVGSCNFAMPGKIVFTNENKELLKADLAKGTNRFLLTFPAVTKARKITISVKINDNPTEKYSFTLLPPKKLQVYFMQHSHTDVGYTRPQSEILAEHMRYLDYALDYCDQTDGLPDDIRFRWTCESAWVTREYLRTRPESQVKRFLKRVAEGRIEVTGMYLNMSEIIDENTMYDFLQPLRDLTQLGIPIKTAMQNDVNGIAWCMPDYFKNTCVKYLSMGINEARSIRPFDKPTCFWWEAPSGERMLAFMSDHYHLGNFFGIVGNLYKRPEYCSDFSANFLFYLAELESKGYPFDKVEISFSGYDTDNSPPSTIACERVKQWNDKYEYPKIRFSVASEFIGYIEKNYGEKLPVYRNAWLDWWTDGFGSASRETAEARKTQNLKQVDEGLLSMILLMGGDLRPEVKNSLEHINENLIFFDEHTVGASESISQPYSENSTKQWLMKGAYAWEAMKQETLLNEEALARFQVFMKKADFPVIYVVNSMGWTRSGDIQLFIDSEVIPVGKKVTIIDLSNGNQVPAQIIGRRREGAYWVIEVNDIPAMGYKALKIEVTEESPSPEVNSGTEILENKFYKLMIDKNTGSISSLYDKELKHELVDGENQYKIGQPVRETTTKRGETVAPFRVNVDVAPYIRTTTSNVKVDKGVNGPIWKSVNISSDLDGYEKGAVGTPKGINLEIRLYKNVKKIEFKYMARKQILTEPEALYVAFPFSLPGSRIVFETTGGILSQGQQLHGSASDWNVAQDFVSIRGKNGQIVIVSNEAPLWQFSDFNMGKYERYPKQGKPWLYSYVMNNYWFTNFRAFQEGAFSWSYQFTSTSDTTNTFATKYSWGERNLFPTRTFTAGINELKTTSMGTLNIAGSANAILLNSRPVKDNKTLLLRFREVDGLPAEVSITSATDQKFNRIIEVSSTSQQIGQPLKSVIFKPYEVKFIELEY
jgi:hypothetical protein